MKTHNQIERETVKIVSDVLSMIGNEKKISSDGLDLSKYEDDEISDGYIFTHAEYVNSIDESGVRVLARSLSINQLSKACPDSIKTLLRLSKEDVDSNNIFTAIETKNGFSQVVMFWKRG